MRRRAFITLLGGAAAWPLAGRGQQAAMPLIGFIDSGTPVTSAHFAAAFRQGLSETGHSEGHNVMIEYYWLDGRYDRLPGLAAELIGRRAAVIAAPASIPAALALKAATTTVPIVFGVGEDPVKLGLVANLARPGGNATGINFFVSEAVTKRLGLLRDLVPGASRIAVMVNPANVATAQTTLRELEKAAGAFGLEIRVFNVNNSREIEAAFATMPRERTDALLVAPDSFFASRRVQFATLAATSRIPASYATHEYVQVGGLMSYGTNIADSFRQAGVYAGNILNGAKPAELPVIQPTKFEFVINLQTARALGIEVPNAIQLLADEIIE